MDRTAIDAAPEQLFKFDDAVAVVEEEAGKHFVGISGQPCFQVAGARRRS
jgi:hypothetical protein